MAVATSLLALLAASPDSLAAHGGEDDGSGVSAAAAAPRLELRRTRRRMAHSGDPIWELRLDLPRGQRHTFDALVGRAQRQQADRHSLGSQAPLPPGLYRLAAAISLDRRREPELAPELGNLLWIALEPQFPTERRGLGIHHDPSAGLQQDSGTDGCIGLIHARDLRALGNLLVRYSPRDLIVLQ